MVALVAKKAVETVNRKAARRETSAGSVTQKKKKKNIGNYYEIVAKPEIL